MDKIKYSENIAKAVRSGIRNGVAVKDIMASIQKYQQAPSSSATFYKLYGDDIAAERAEIVGQIGSVVIQQALDGDFKAAELFLRSKGGWSPTQTNVEVESNSDPDEDVSAIDSLMTLLGKKDDSSNNGEGSENVTRLRSS
jgi:hypothetical protein